LEDITVWLPPMNKWQKFGVLKNSFKSLIHTYFVALMAMDPPVV
jgi:hypothetical protein